MIRVNQLPILLSGIAAGIAGTLYWLVLVDGMTQFQRPAVIAGFVFVALGLVLTIRQRRAHD